MKTTDKYEYHPKEDFLGKGAFGNVFRGKNQQTGEIVAIKFVNMHEFNDQFMLLSLKNEIDIMKQLEHDNIVKLLDVFGDNKNTVMIIELCDGDLRQFLRNHQNQILPEDQAINILKQFMKGYQELFNKNYIHRDIKPENVLYKQQCYKIADFGFATKAKEGQHEKFFRESVGTPLYMAPQLLEKQQYTSKCDIWSIGILAFEMVYGKQPWSCRDKQSYLNNMKKQPLKFPIDIKISDEYQDFIKQCLKVQEKDRINWDNLFKHKILQDNINNQRNYTQFEIKIDEEGLAILARIQKIVQSNGLDVNEQFKKFDQDGGGSLDFKEFFQFIIQLDQTLTGKDIKLLFTKIDQDNNEKIDKEEFKKIFCQYDYLNEKPVDRIITDLKEIIKANQYDINKIFQKYDLDHQGDLTLSEFSQMIKHEIAKDIKDYDIQEIFKKFDLDDDQKINIEEFRNQLEPNREQDPIESHIINKFLEKIIPLIKVNNIQIELIFKNFAKNQVDEMNFNEFSKLCNIIDRDFTEIERRQIFKFVNLDDKNGITLNEFQQIFK